MSEILDHETPLSGNPIPWDQRSQIGFFPALINTIQLVLLHPREFFSRVDLKTSYGSPYLFYIILSLTFNMLALVVKMVFLHEGSVVDVIATVISILVMIFVGSGFMHIFVLPFSGQQGFKGTFNVFAYSSAANILLLIMILATVAGAGLLASLLQAAVVIAVSIWSIIIGVAGYREVHRLSLGKALTAYFAPFLIFFVIGLGAAVMIPGFVKGKMSASDALAKATLRTLSTAAETYATANNGKFPVSISDLTTAVPPYVSQEYCSETISGYSYACIFSAGGYTITATPVQPGLSGTTTYTISTGGNLEPENDDASGLAENTPPSSTTHLDKP